MNVFIIPGNPPATRFYQDWCDEIRRENPLITTCVSSYPLYPKKADSHQYFQKVVEFHDQNLEKFLTEINGPATIVAHSLGAWIGLKLLEQKDLHIQRCILLYPFLRKPTLRGRTLLKLSHELHKTRLFEKSVLKSRKLIEKFMKELRYLSDNEIKSFLNLAHHEHVVVAKNEKKIHIAPHLRPKLHMFYCDKDTWCPRTTVHELSRQILATKTSAHHGFIISKNERAHLWRQISRLNQV